VLLETDWFIYDMGMDATRVKQGFANPLLRHSNLTLIASSLIGISRTRSTPRRSAIEKTLDSSNDMSTSVLSDRQRDEL
jgi:hypothetical protein